MVRTSMPPSYQQAQWSDMGLVFPEVTDICSVASYSFKIMSISGDTLSEKPFVQWGLIEVILCPGVCINNMLLCPVGILKAYKSGLSI